MIRKGQGNKKKREKSASSGNRTRDICLEGRYFTTKLMMLSKTSFLSAQVNGFYVYKIMNARAIRTSCTLYVSCLATHK